MAETMRRLETEYHAGLTKTLEVSSESFTANGDIPPVFTCRGVGHSPEVTWKNVPANAMSYVLIFIDWDVASQRVPTSSITHWMLYNIPRQETAIAAGTTSADLRRKTIVEGENSFGERGYAVPCARSQHRYIVRIYALDVPEIHPLSRDREAIVESMRGHILSFGELAGHFGS